MRRFLIKIYIFNGGIKMNIDKFTIISYDAITGFDRVNGGLVLVMDEISDFSLYQTQETSDLTG